MSTTIVVCHASGRTQRVPLFNFGSEALTELHREIRCQFRAQFVRHATYAVHHSAHDGSEGFYTLNTATPGQTAVGMQDLAKRGDGTFEVRS